MLLSPAFKLLGIFCFLNGGSFSVLVWVERFFFSSAYEEGFRIAIEIIWSRLLNLLEMWSFNVCFRLYKYSCCFRMWVYDIQCLEIPALQCFLSPLLTSVSMPLCHDLLPFWFYHHRQSQCKLDWWTDVASFKNQTCFFVRL